VAKTCLELLRFAILIWDQIRQAKADCLLVLLVPGLRAWLRYWRSLAWWQGRSLRTRSLTPLERFLNLSSRAESDPNIIFR